MTGSRGGSADVPVDITRDEAQRLAQRELADPRYHADDPSLVERALRWLLDGLADLLDRAGGAAPGGVVGLVALAVLTVVAVVAIRFTVGRVGRVATLDGSPFDEVPRTAAQYRQAADDYAARGQWALAVRERLRAVVRDLEERDVLESRAGRTAGEVAEEAGGLLPGCAAELREAARIFDEIWYGGRQASAGTDARMRELDAAVHRARPIAAAR